MPNGERRGTRWLLVFYDLFFYLLITWLIFWKHPSQSQKITAGSAAIHLLLCGALIVLFTLVTALAIRIAYYYLYLWGTKETKAGRLIRRCVSTLGLVDFDSPEGGVLQVVLQPTKPSQEPINEM